MKLVKSLRNVQTMYDTQDPAFVAVVLDTDRPPVATALHRSMRDHDFLAQYFPPQHEIFWDFGSAYFYAWPETTTPAHLPA